MKNKLSSLIMFVTAGRVNKTSTRWAHVKHLTLALESEHPNQMSHRQRIIAAPVPSSSLRLHHKHSTVFKWLSLGRLRPTASKRLFSGFSFCNHTESIWSLRLTICFSQSIDDFRLGSRFVLDSAVSIWLSYWMSLSFTLPPIFLMTILNTRALP